MALAERLRSCLYQPQTVPMLSRLLSSKTIFSCDTISQVAFVTRAMPLLRARGASSSPCVDPGCAIDMIVTDINLLGRQIGWDVARRFRSEQPDMPVIYISGERFDPERCVPGSVFVAKPYQHIDILSACRRLHDR